MTVNSEWWRGASIYQIYPRSYADSNADGIGDLNGIISKLDYIASLHVDAIWLSPFFTSPMKDFGYDVADYCDVDPMFGNLDDFKQMVSKAHDLGLKVIIDQVYSHTSDRHAWFEESRQSKTNAKADWYVWADAKEDGTAPNNWLSLFGGSAWQWDSRREQYFLHNFLSSQPDLNFHCIAVQDAILDAARFWLDLGVDGFRLDVVNMYFHDAALTNNAVAKTAEQRFVGIDPSNPFSRQHHAKQMCRPDNLAFLQRLRSVMNEYPDTTTVGEIGAPDALNIMAQYTSGGDKLHMAYTFDLLGPNCAPAYLRDTLTRVEQKLQGGWPCFALSNHDVIRSATRWTHDSNHPEQKTRTMLAMLATIRGSICLYQGEELGLPEADVPFEALQDPFGIEFWPQFKGRDGCRTPMAWDDSTALGFSTSENTWLPTDPRHAALAVSKQDNETQSVLNFVRELLAWRNDQPALKVGDFEWQPSQPDLLVFTRSHAQQQLLIAINLTEQAIAFEPPASATLIKGVDTPNGQLDACQFAVYELA